MARGGHVAMVRDVARRNDARSVVLLTRCPDREVLRSRLNGRLRRNPGWHELTWDHVGSFAWDPPSDADA